MIIDRLTKLTQLVIESDCSFGEEKASLEKSFELFREFLKASSMTYIVGNGGSAGIASHFATDLLKTLKLPASVLTDPSIMTCMSNDYGYENVFREPLKLLMKENDLLVAISSSGKSSNIINAVKAAKEKGIKVVTLSGFSKENPLRKLGDINFWMNVSDYGLVEMGHFFLLHTLVDLWNETPLERILEHACQSKNL